MTAQRFSASDLAELAPHWDAAVDRTPGIDPFCTSSVWSFSAATSFPEVAPPVLVGDGDAFCGLRAVTTADETRILVGLDPIWGFASPLVGPPRAAARMLDRRLALERYDIAIVAAQRDDSVLTAWVARGLDRHVLRRGPVQERLRIDLAAGVDAWLARRSPRFRQQLRRLRRDAVARGVAFDDLSAMAPDDVFERVLAIEATSWKGSEGTGLSASELARFYRQVTGRLAARDQLRVLVARLDDADVGFILGGVRGDTYRGLQLSHDRRWAALGLGHLLQLEQLERLVLEGVAVYDLGMDMEYKRRWADRVDETFSLVVSP